MKPALLLALLLAIIVMATGSAWARPSIIPHASLREQLCRIEYRGTHWEWDGGSSAEHDRRCHLRYGRHE